LRQAIENAVARLSREQHHKETTAAIEGALDLSSKKPDIPETVELLGAGWVAEEALAISLFCSLTAKDFRSGVLLAVNHELNENGVPTGIVELPVDWIRDDATLLDPLGDNYTPPRELLQVYLDELDKAYEEGTMLLLPMHPRAMGHRSRIVILEELIDHVHARGGAWFATHREAAEYVKTRCLER